MPYVSQHFCKISLTGGYSEYLHSYRIMLFCFVRTWNVLVEHFNWKLSDRFAGRSHATVIDDCWWGSARVVRLTWYASALITKHSSWLPPTSDSSTASSGSKPDPRHHPIPQPPRTDSGAC